MARVDTQCCSYCARFALWFLIVLHEMRTGSMKAKRAAYRYYIYASRKKNTGRRSLQLRHAKRRAQCGRKAWGHCMVARKITITQSTAEYALSNRRRPTEKRKTRQNKMECRASKGTWYSFVHQPASNYQCVVTLVANKTAVIPQDLKYRRRHSSIFQDALLHQK